MSYILDALRKAERERRGGRPPTLDTVHAVPLRSRRRWWPWVLAGLVVANLVTLVVIGPGAFLTGAPIAVTRALPPTPPEPGTVPPAGVETPVPRAGSPSPAPTTSTFRPSPPGGEAAGQVAPPVVSRPPVAVETPPRPPRVRPASPSPVAPVPPAAPEPVAVPPVRAPVAAAPASPPAAMPAVVAPPIAAPPAPAAPAAPEPGAGVTLPVPAPPADPAPPPAGPAPTMAPAGSPLREAVGRMTLDVLVYSEDVAERFVFINGRKHVEGQSVEGTVMVEVITREGALLSAQGERVLLRPKSNPYLP